MDQTAQIKALKKEIGERKPELMAMQRATGLSYASVSLKLHSVPGWEYTYVPEPASGKAEHKFFVWTPGGILRESEILSA